MLCSFEKVSVTQLRLRQGCHGLAHTRLAGNCLCFSLSRGYLRIEYVNFEVLFVH